MFAFTSTAMFPLVYSICLKQCEHKEDGEDGDVNGYGLRAIIDWSNLLILFITSNMQTHMLAHAYSTTEQIMYEELLCFCV